MNKINNNNALQTFFYQEKNVRTIMIDGETWWVLKDICDVLDLANPTVVVRRLDEDERAKLDLGRQGEANIINESALYKVILRSDKPEAKNFMNWITRDILPSIRKHGAYVTASKVDELLKDPDTLIKLFTTIKEERLEKEKLQNQIENDRPKILFADAVSISEGSILIGELAKILRGNGIEIGQNRLFERLRQNDFLIKRKGTDYNTPTQRAMELGLFKLKETVITHSDGCVKVFKTTKVSGKGQRYFINYFLSKKENKD